MIWPEVMNYCVAKIREADPKVAFIDAALLIEAGWSSSLHEVWVTFVPEEEVPLIFYLEKKMDKTGKHLCIF
jgi:dephospho-CoA kinase